MNNAVVTVKKYVAIFAIIYFLLTIIHMVCSGVFHLPYISELDYAKLILSALTACYAFTRKNDRVFESIEYRNIVIGSVGVDALWKLGISIPFSIIDAKLSVIEFLVLFVTYMATHTLVIGFLYSSLIVSLFVKRKNVPLRKGRAQDI